MLAQIKPWGNSQGIRIPKDLLNEMDVHINDYVNIEKEGSGILITKTFRHRTLEERAGEFGGELGPLEEYDWGEPQGKEFW